MAKPISDGHPFCFRCKYFYREEGEKYVSAHCPFQIYVGCEGRAKAVDLGDGDLRREE